MTDLLRRGSQWLEQMRTAHGSSQVTYRRDVTELPVNATYGCTQVEVADESGLTVQSAISDFLILADELGLEPEPGDEIVADSQVYEVMNLGGEGCWRWSDPYRTTLRIHTREMGEA